MSEVPDCIRASIEKLELDMDSVSIRVRRYDDRDEYRVRVSEQISINAEEMRMLLASCLESVMPYMCDFDGGPIAGTRLTFVIKK